MFACVYNVFFFLFIAFPLYATATAIPRGDYDGHYDGHYNGHYNGHNDGPHRSGGHGGNGGSVTSNSCNVGSVSCCNQVQSANSHTVNNLFGILGLELGSITGQVGINCSPVSVIGAGGNSCSAQPVCCTGNHFNGGIVVGCSPININL